MFLAGAVVESDAWPAGVQPKREAKLLTVIWLTPMYVVCYIVSNLYRSETDFTKSSAKIIASIYISECIY